MSIQGQGGAGSPPCGVCGGSGSVVVAKDKKDADGKTVGQTSEYKPCPQCRGSGKAALATK